MVDETTKEYLIKLMKECEKYDVFSEALGFFEDAGKVRLQDVYTMPRFLDYKEAWMMRAPHSMSLIQEEISRVLTIKKTQEKPEQEMVEYGLTNVKSFGLEKKQKDESAKRYKKIIYADRDCGRRSFARIYALLCAYKALGESATEDKSLERLLSHNTMLENFSVNEEAIPVIVSMYAFRHYPLINWGEKDVFEEAIKNEIRLVLEDTNNNCVEHVYRQNAIALIITNIGSGDEVAKWFWEPLKKFLDKEEEKIITVVLTAHRWAVDELCDFVESLKLEQYFLPGLQHGRESIEWTIEFARNWYKGWGDVSGRKMDVEKDFLLPFSRNAEVISRVETPKELTDILLVSVYDSCLPSDVVSVDNRFREIKLEKEGLSDIVPNLAKVAYELMDSGKEYITEKRLMWYMAGGERIHECGFDFVKDEIDCIDDSCAELLQVRKIIERLKFIGIISLMRFVEGYGRSNRGTRVKRLSGETGNNFYFTNQKDEAYFVAYAVKNNLIKDNVRKKRFDYIRDRIVKKEEAWRNSIICLAVIDDKLQAEIINELLKLAQEEENDSYYMALLLEMLTNPSIVFLFSEIKLFFELLNKRCNWNLFDRRREKIEQLARQSSRKECEQWVSTMLGEYQTIDDKYFLTRYYASIREILFFCAQQCGLEDMVAEVLEKHKL